MAELNDGDWVEGAPKWWWKYVFPNPERFWLQIISLEPEPAPWLQRVTGEVLEGLAMLHAASRATEDATVARLKSEAVSKISQAVAAVRQG